MRKQFKKVLSMVLSAAMTLSLASGVSLATEKSASAAAEWTAVEFTAAELSFTFAGEGTPTFMDKEWEGFKGAGDYKIDVYAGMTAAWTGNVGWIKCPETYTISKTKLTLTTADGPVVLDLGNYTAEVKPDAEKDGYKVDFPNMWNLTDEVAAWTSEDETVRLVKTEGNALGLEMKKEAAPVETEAPATSGDATETPDPDKTADPGTGGATKPGATDAPDPADELFETGIVMTSQDYAIGGAGPEDVNAAEAAGVKLYDTKVSGKGQYQVATDLRVAGGAAGIQFTALYIIGAEKYFPNYVIRLDHMKINGEDVSEETLKKAYTCSDDGTTTRVNLHNAWCNEDDASKEPPRPDARSMEDLKNCTPYMLEDYADDEIMTMEIAFTYGPKDYVSEQDKASIAESLIPEKPELEDPDPVQTPGPDQPGQPTPNPNQPTQNPGGTQPTKAPAAPTQAPAAGLTNGTTAKVGGATYKVTDAKAAAVEFSAPKKNATSVTIPATVKVNGKSCKVTSIKAKAFSGNKKLKSVVIGKNIKTIGKQAFFKCTKLKKVTFKGTAVKKIGAKAFAKTNKKMTVTVPKKLKKKALNSYKKLLKKAGVSKKAKYKKK